MQRILIILAFCIASVPAHALACTGAAGIGISGSTLFDLSESYDPFSIADLTETQTMVVTNQSEEPCEISVIFATTAGTPKLRAGGRELDYRIETPGGATFVVPASATGAPGHNAYEILLDPGVSAAIDFRLRIKAGQMTGPGLYRDTDTALAIHGLAPGGDKLLLGVQPLVFSADVRAVCVLPDADPMLLDLSGLIGADSLPVAGTHAVRLNEVACNMPVQVLLSGDPLRLDAGMQSPAGLDDFINVEARASFGAAHAHLVTETASTMTAVSPEPSAVQDLAGMIDLDIGLVRARKLMSGSYSSVLTLTLSPRP